jgi:hypothetical protein
MTRRISTLFVLPLAFAVSAAAQESKPAAPRRDAAAVKLLEAHDALMYYPREAGLKDLSCSLKLPGDVLVDLKWKAPSFEGWAVRPAPEAKPEIAKRILIGSQSPEYRAQMQAQVPSYIKTLVGERESVKFAEDGLELVAERQVRIVAVAPGTKQVLREATATFDERGLVKSLSITSPVGAVSTMQSTYLERNGKFLVKEMRITTPTPAGPQVTNLANEYVDVGAYAILKKIVLKNGPIGDQEHVYVDHKVDAGLTEADFKK